jgi:glycosyltransferase involved in cell wall biosynthesis
VQTDFDFYQQLSLVVMPSFWIRETIGLTALEALQAGLPVLVPHTGNLEHFILENLAIPIAPDPDDIAKKIVLCCEELEKNCSRKRNKTQDIKNNFNAFYQKIFCE